MDINCLFPSKIWLRKAYHWLRYCYYFFFFWGGGSFFDSPCAFNPVSTGMGDRPSSGGCTTSVNNQAKFSSSSHPWELVLQLANLHLLENGGETVKCGELYSLENCYWVTKMALRRWSAVAKRSFERTARRRGICITQDCNSESVYFTLSNHNNSVQILPYIVI